MTDIKCGEFVVKGIEYDECTDGSRDKYHMMEKGSTPRSGEYLIGENGEKYHILCSRGEHGPKDGQFQLGFAFDDQSIELPIGTILKRGPEEWRKKIPDSKIIRIECESRNIYINFDENKPFKIAYKTYVMVNAAGDVCISKRKYEDPRSTVKIRINAGTVKAEQLFSDMFWCVSADNSYSYATRHCDDIARGYLMYFENGESIHYGEAICNGDTDLREILYGFLKDCESEMDFRVSDSI